MRVLSHQIQEKNDISQDKSQKGLRVYIIIKIEKASIAMINPKRDWEKNYWIWDFETREENNFDKSQKGLRDSND